MKTTVFYAETTLKVGSKGLAVMILQLILLALGYNTEKMLPDGDYGDETEAAVNEYKKYSALTGIEKEKGFGPLMLLSLKEEDNVDLISASYEEEPAEQG